MSRSLFQRIWTAVRAADWWAYKIPPLLITIYAGLLRFNRPDETWPLAVSALTAILLVAVYGYVLNDICDIEADRRSGRPNRMANVGWIGRIVLLVGPAAGALALAWRTDDAIMLAIVGSNLALPTLYSVPPVRLKGRGVLGALADAGGVHALPMALVARAVTVDTGGADGMASLFVASTIGWTAFAGLRGIIVHQVADLHADRLADVTTFAARIGVERARRLVLGALFPLELLSLGVFLALVLPAAPVVAIVLLAFAAIEVLRMYRGWKLPLFEPTETSRERYLPILNNEIYEVWLPLGLAIQIALTFPRLWPLVVLHLLLFLPNIHVRLIEAGKTLALPNRRSAPPPYGVVVAATAWTVNGVNVFSANLVRRLVYEGVKAHVLLTEQETDLVDTFEKSMPASSDVPFELLPAGRTESWGAHWGAMARYLEESAPCIYVPNSDWRHSCVCPLLSDDVIVVGVVHSDDPLHYDHVRRLGRYWNAVVAVSDQVRRKTIEVCPEVADRITTIPIGVRIPPQQPSRPPAHDRLRVVYHGILKQHQKRVLDFPRIVQAAIDLGVPVELTIVGAGPDELALRAAAASLVEQGAIRFAGVVSPDDTPAILERHDVYLLASEFEGMPNALIEAMGRGLVPVVSRMTSGIPELVRDGENGFMAPIGDAPAFAERLRTLWADSDLRDRMAASAFRTVSEGGFRVEDMTRAYRKVFDRAWHEAKSGRFVRPKGLLDHPPVQVAGVDLFRISLDHVEPGVGAFETPDDAEDFQEQVRAIRKGSRRHAAGSYGYVPGTTPLPSLDGVRVFVAAPVWTPTGVNRWSEDVVRGLRRAGMDARVLLTEESTPLVTIDAPRMSRPADVPFEELQVSGNHSWGGRWGALVRTLEAAAPCIYIPSYDWRHACITPVLSNRVIVVGVLHDTGPLYTEQALRLGASWNVIVATGRSIRRHVRQLLPGLRGRIATIPHGLDVPVELAPKDWDDRAMTVLIPSHAVSVLSIAEAFLQNGAASVIVVDPPESDRTALAAAGARLVIDPNRLEWLSLCGESHVVAGAGDPQIDRAIFEAMGRGCIPVLAPTAALDEAARTGIVVSDGRWDQAALLVRDLASVSDRKHAAMVAAHRLARGVAYRSDRMIATYLDLFRKAMAAAESESFQRSGGMILPPPAEIEGIPILPAIAGAPHVQDVGTFPSVEAAEDYENERWPSDAAQLRLRGISPAEARAVLTGVRVFVSAPVWTPNGVNLWSEDLVRGLCRAGIDARLLLTEESTVRVTSNEPRMTRPTDIPVEELRVREADNWGARWGALLRLLEDAAPCIYIPNFDWRHAAVTPLLSDRVMVVGMLHAADASYMEQAERIGDVWNAAVAGSRDVARHALRSLPGLRGRLTSISYGFDVPSGVARERHAPSETITVVVIGRSEQASEDAGQWRRFVEACVGNPGWQIVVIDSVDPDVEGCGGPAAASVRVLAHPNRQEWIALCDTSEFVVAFESSHDTTRRLIEAMGHGCVPVLVGTESSDNVPVLDHENGMVVPAGVLEDAVSRMRALVDEPETRAAMSERAHAAAYGRGGRMDQMVETYLQLFAHVRIEAETGRFLRPVGRLRPPPAKIDGVGIFPVTLEYVTDFGTFPSREDARGFVRESGRTSMESPS